MKSLLLVFGIFLALSFGIQSSFAIEAEGIECTELVEAGRGHASAPVKESLENELKPQGCPDDQILNDENKCVTKEV